MDSPTRVVVVEPRPQVVSPCSSGRRRSLRRRSLSNSPEFEFWMVRNPSCPQPNLLSADELFVDGVLLPLHQLNIHHPPPPDPPPAPAPATAPSPPLQPPPDDLQYPYPCCSTSTESAEQSQEAAPPEDIISSATSTAATEATSTTTSTASKRWKDIFKKGDKKSSKAKNHEAAADQGSKEKEKNKRDKNSHSSSVAAPAELNINIWPFSRSRSAGNSSTGARPRMFPGAAGARKVSSAPCSRSNSAGESKSRKWPSSPGRPGVHLGRSSPVWQVRRGGGGGGGNSKSISGHSLEAAVLLRNSEKCSSKKELNEHHRRGNKTSTAGSSSGNKAVKVLNLNVPMCIGYRHHLSCRSDENTNIGGAAGGRNRSGNVVDSRSSGINININSGGVGNGNLFNLRSLFTKKVY